MPLLSTWWRKYQYFLIHRKGKSVLTRERISLIGISGCGIKGDRYTSELFSVLLLLSNIFSF
jgi:hypothetical protein